MKKKPSGTIQKALWYENGTTIRRSVWRVIKPGFADFADQKIKIHDRAYVLVQGGKTGAVNDFVCIQPHGKNAFQNFQLKLREALFSGEQKVGIPETIESDAFGGFE